MNSVLACEVRVMSAHRTPDVVQQYATTARERGLRVIIAAAGGAAHLAGVVAAHTTLPVIGLPVPTPTWEDSIRCCRRHKCRATSRSPPWPSAWEGAQRRPVRGADPGRSPTRHWQRNSTEFKQALGTENRGERRPFAGDDSQTMPNSGQETLRWEGAPDGQLVLIDQTLLPVEFQDVHLHDCRQDVWEAIKQLEVSRGAPAIGIAAAYGVVLGCSEARQCGPCRSSCDQLGTGHRRICSPVGLPR